MNCPLRQRPDQNGVLSGFQAAQWHAGGRSCDPSVCLSALTQHWGRSYRKCLFWEITIVKRASVLGLIVLQHTEPAVAFKDRQFHVLDIFHALLAQLRVEL